MTSTQKFGPTPDGVGEDLGQDFFIGVLGPMLRGGDGVDGPAGLGSALQVYGNNSGRQVLVRPGNALIRGEGYQLTGDDLVVTLPANGTGSTRTDRIVVRHDPSLGDSQGQITRIAGTPGAGAPALVRAVGGIWDVPLAKVNCAAGYSGIGPADVIDDRQWLPLAIQFVDTSRQPYPPVDGSAGHAFWDLNPAQHGLIVTDGAGWAGVQAGDTGWVNLAWNSTNWNVDSFGPQVRKAGAVVEVVASFQFNALSGPSYPMFTMPAWARPSRNRDWLINISDYDGAAYGFATVSMLTDGTVLLGHSLEIDPSQRNPMVRGSIRADGGTRIEFSLTFIA